MNLVTCVLWNKSLLCWLFYGFKGKISRQTSLLEIYINSITIVPLHKLNQLFFLESLQNKVFTKKVLNQFLVCGIGDPWNDNKLILNESKKLLWSSWVDPGIYKNYFNSIIENKKYFYLWLRYSIRTLALKSLIIYSVT